MNSNKNEESSLAFPEAENTQSFFSAFILNIQKVPSALLVMGICFLDFHEN